MPCQSNWAHLPYDLLDLILINLEAAEGLQSILLLRLVCSSWRAAVSQYSGPIIFHLESKNELTAICHMVPCLSELGIETPLAEVNLGALLKCSTISTLSLTKYIPPEPAVSEDDPLYAAYEIMENSTLVLDCAHLPASLVELCLDNVQIDPESVQSLSCLQLKKMKYLWDYSTPAEACDLLKRLPNLEDLYTGPSEHYTAMSGDDNEFTAFLGLTTLTSLKLESGNFWHAAELPLGANIRKLELVGIGVPLPVLHELCSQLSHMTRLSLRSVQDVAEIQPSPLTPMPENRLRCLQLHSADSDFIGLAGPSLETLTCGSSFLDYSLPRAIAQAAPRLARLTCLTLASCQRIGDISFLRIFGLRELVLVDSSELCWQLFGQGGFFALKSLQIIETRNWPQPSGLLDYLEYITREAGECELLWRLGQIVLGLPSLVRLSGRCRLFSIGMSEDLRDWSRSPMNFRADSYLEEIAGHEWIKPVQA